MVFGPLSKKLWVVNSLCSWENFLSSHKHVIRVAIILHQMQWRECTSKHTTMEGARYSQDDHIPHTAPVYTAACAKVVTVWEEMAQLHKHPEVPGFAPRTLTTIWIHWCTPTHVQDTHQCEWVDGRHKTQLLQYSFQVTNHQVAKSPKSMYTVHYMRAIHATD